MFNVQQTTSRLAEMSDAQLAQYAAMHKNDPYVLSLASSESNRRKELRNSAQAQMAGMKPPTVADQTVAGMEQDAQQEDMPHALPEERGIGRLPAQNIAHMADGGIAGYADGGNAIDQYAPQIVAEAKRLGIDPKLALRMFTQESKGDKSAISPKGAAGLGQLMKSAAKDMGISEEDRFDPSKNITASLGYLKKQLNQFKDPVKAVAAYNWGPGNLKKHLAKNNGEINPVGLPKETADYINKLLPIGAANAAETTDEIPRTQPAAAAPAQRAPTQAAVPAARTAPARTGIAAIPKASPAEDDTVYDPMTGAPISGGVAHSQGPQSNSPVAAQLAGIADIPLGIPAALYGTAKTDFLNLPFGKHYTWEEAQKAGNDNWLQYLTLGKSLGLEKDPAYRKDPFNYLAQLPAMGVEKIAEGTGTNKAAAQSILDNVTAVLPFLGKTKGMQVEYNMPKLKGKETPSVAAAEAELKQAEADRAKTEAAVASPRLGYTPENAKPGIKVSPEGTATLPDSAAMGNALGAEKRGQVNWAEDVAARNAAAERAAAAEAQAEAARTAAEKAKPGAAAAFLTDHPWTRQGIAAAPYGVLSANRGLSDTDNEAIDPNAPPVSPTYPDEQYRGMKPGPDEPANAVTEFTKTVEPETKPAGSGFSNEDILTMGLNMMQARPGQGGGALSQLASNIGTSGIATLAARKEREKMAQEQAYKDIVGQYYKAKGEEAQANAAYTNDAKSETALRTKAAGAIETAVAKFQATGMADDAAVAKYRADVTREVFRNLGLSQTAGGISDRAAAALKQYGG